MPLRLLHRVVTGAGAPVLLSTALLFLGCGSGGGEDPIIRSATFLDEYRYQLGNDADSSPQLFLSTISNGFAIRLALDFSQVSGLAGNYNWISDYRSIDAGSAMLVETSIYTPVIGAFRVEVSADISAAADGAFLEGAWRVYTGTDIVDVVVVSDTQAGVTLQRNGGDVVNFNWPDFIMLFYVGSISPTWQQAASASFQLMRLMLGQVVMAFDALRGAASASFSTTPYVRACDAFSGTVPSGVLLQGERVLTWLGSADLGFDLRFIDCWDNRPGVDEDYLYRGALELSGWRAANDGSNRLIFVGFGGDEFGSRVPGGIEYRELRLDLAGSFGIAGLPMLSSAPWFLDGGYAIGFATP